MASGLAYSLALCDDNPMAVRSPGMTRAFSDVVRASERAGVELVVVGALARNVYLTPRTTDDADFLVRSLEQAARVMDESKDDFEPTEVELVTRLVHRSTGAKVDLIVAEYGFEFEGMDEALKHKVRRRAVRVMPADHLAAMKVDAAGDPRRPLDFGEVVLLFLEGVAQPAHVEALIRRDLPSALPTLERILAAVERAKNAAQRPARGRSKAKDVP
ncbi:MAG: hypothetical protein HY791_18680 [Deltaproteobacteria bacterium]|nr:hypothetical protein [Deltaproteobacteria bacterium]